MKINFKKLNLLILGTILIGGIFAMLTMGKSSYANLNKPFDVPGIVFPIVWVILYILMGISIYIISEDKYKDKTKAYTLYIVQLIMNSLWTLFFFGFNWYTFSAIWIVLLLIAVILMIISFFKIDKKAAYLQIPYVLWLLFALYLNVSIAIMN